MVYKTSLEAKVAAVNAANKAANELYDSLVEVFRPLVGQKILKADGSLMAKVQKLMPSLPDTRSGSSILYAYRHASAYSLAWTVKACESSEGKYEDCQYANYHETTVYVGKITGDVLTDIEPPPNFPTQYDARTVTLARENYHKAKAAADAAYSKLHPFGEHDW